MLVRQIRIALWQADMSTFGQHRCRELRVKQCWPQKSQTQEATLHEVEDQRRSLCFNFQDCSKRSGCQSVVAEKAKVSDSSSSVQSQNHKGCIQWVICVIEPNRTFTRLSVPGREIRLYLGRANTSDGDKNLQNPGYCSLSLKVSNCVWSSTRLSTSSARVERHTEPQPLLTLSCQSSSKHSQGHQIHSPSDTSLGILNLQQCSAINCEDTQHSKDCWPRKDKWKAGVFKRYLLML